MSDWEQHANHSLRALGEALQRGQLDRGEYRARRRRILLAGAVHTAQTQPNALQPAVPAGAAASVSAASAGRGGRRWPFIAAGVTLLAALLAWWGMFG